MLFLFRPRKFCDYAAKHDIALVLTEERDLRERYQRGQYEPNVEEARAKARHASSLLRRSLLRTGLVVLAAGVLGLCVGVTAQALIGRLGSLAGNLLQALGIGMILWPTLWELTRDIETWGNRTLSERIHSWLFKLLYTVGTFVFFVVYGWQVEL